MTYGDDDNGMQIIADLSDVSDWNYCEDKCPHMQTCGRDGIGCDLDYKKTRHFYKLSLDSEKNKYWKISECRHEYYFKNIKQLRAELEAANATLQGKDDCIAELRSDLEAAQVQPRCDLPMVGEPGYHKLVCDSQLQEIKRLKAAISLAIEYFDQGEKMHAQYDRDLISKQHTKAEILLREAMKARTE